MLQVFIEKFTIMGDIVPPVPPKSGIILPPVPPQAASCKTLGNSSLSSSLPTRPQAVKQRWYLPDLTGFYEHRPNKGKSSALVLQLNQAGRVVVGWFAAPPSFVTGGLLSDTNSRKPGQNGTRMLPGVLVAFLPEGNFPPNGVIPFDISCFTMVDL
jgi:hypothetical protein